MNATNRVTSKDGTAIAYERRGRGPALILVGGGLDDGSENAPLASKLAQHFTVYNYQRRGRGGSGDTPPYAVEREVEDIAALIARAGGTADLYGVSSGGALVLEAAHAGVAANKLAVYAVPYDTAPNTARPSHDDPAANAVATGGNAGPLEAAADVIAAALPRGQRLRLEDQSHVPDPAVLGPVLNASSWDNAWARRSSNSILVDILRR